MREVASRALENKEGGGLQEGDVLLKINNHTTDGMTLKEARKLIEASKEKLNLVVRREYKTGGGGNELTALPKGMQVI